MKAAFRDKRPRARSSSMCCSTPREELPEGDLHLRLDQAEVVSVKAATASRIPHLTRALRHHCLKAVRSRKRGRRCGADRPDQPQAIRSRTITRSIADHKGDGGGMYGKPAASGAERMPLITAHVSLISMPKPLRLSSQDILPLHGALGN